MSEQPKKKLCCTGLLAHVDAGKTTLSEALLYEAGVLRQLGRVDHRDSFLDTHSLERARGITIFSKQARLTAGSLELTLLDTPGHMDFSPETERTMQVLDYGILVVSGTDGVQAHTETLWRLLRQYKVPVFVFVNKMDLPGADRQAVLRDLTRCFGEGFADFTQGQEAISEGAAMCEEPLLERFLETGQVPDEEIRRLIRERRLFPCFFGSALKLEGVSELLLGLEQWTQAPKYPEAFGARVYKIGRDSRGARLTYLKVTGGTLPLRGTVRYTDAEGKTVEEKAKELRRYSGEKYAQMETAPAGTVCAVLGLTKTFPGQGLGAEQGRTRPSLEPVLAYRLVLPPDCDPLTLLPKLRLLEEEDPTLRVQWQERTREIHIRLMGAVQIEIVKSLIQERFGVSVQMDAGRILYRETIEAPVEGVGHFEPLRHYAEVHLLLEPLPRGSGLEFRTKCPEDILDRNWQRLILTHLREKTHLGVLTGSPVTDLRITLMSGKAHLKHTEGGDFREATYRAVRQGLMQAKSLLLEPYYHFVLWTPMENIGRAMGDMKAMGGIFEPPSRSMDSMELRGTVPVAKLGEYAQEVTAYTGGRGRLSCSPGGYAPCREQEKLLEAWAYDPEADLENTPDSVFCAHGAGFPVKWDQVPQYMHLESCLPGKAAAQAPARRRSLNLDDRELEAIMEREFGPIKRPQYGLALGESAAKQPIAPPAPRTDYLIVDGYNIIFAWDELKALAREDLAAARQRLMELLANYRAYKRREVVLVFDGYRVKGGAGERLDYHGLHVVYTRENETGDMYMEAMAAKIGKNDRVWVATSDSLIQLAAVRSGVLRMSARELRQEVEAANGELADFLKKLNEQENRKMGKKDARKEEPDRNGDSAN